MDTYSLLREIADSWVLLAMFVFFALVVLWAFRPGSRKVHQDTANIPFRHEDKPAGDGDHPGAHLKEARQ
ncbi:cbb3-type cytochrome c oxidase subunit 3 [Aliiroseovarius subalbicans]|uniref:cbb3-type cytochrome c oxidase subunit 3 n=1 Tax=Aliiroseovarius subalbicans TaxID=2925840 RepID=UPI001F5A5879|nr:cbb3-type cytochrome c oxidase subunit 3 [Aliiroseovarius subalbicans]MCI2400642.1 cbb3-type cytochrome c oxidase subunit 3 [Aliiroseovarius subalbicans]